jgi:E3 SUMO-protein ligase PIAS1
MTQHRNSNTITLKTSEHAALHRCVTEKTMRVMVFCAADDRGVQDIAFPHQSELKVNGGEIKANLRGLKGKAGSTRPVDITDSLRLDKTSYVNNIEFTYALTNKVKKHQNQEPPVSICLPGSFSKQ